MDRARARLEEMLQAARRIPADLMRWGAGSTPSAKLERDILVDSGLRRLAELDLGDEALVFGRIDRCDHETFYIGRVGVHDETHEPVVVDWRAPVAEPFYRATPKSPMGLSRRRHFMTRGPVITGIDDELLDAPRSDGRMVLVGEAALMEALQRSRTGRMRDIVSTIQAEQDEVIRAPLQGVLIVQGGPGTGKTAVALHRAAYMLYTHRALLQQRGVLLVGPSPAFLGYIEQVLPSLGEQTVTLATTASLVSGFEVTAIDEPEVARIKGDSRMAVVTKNAVAGLSRPLVQPETLKLD
ncbi:MAG TPA: UvrD-helicase domain-containing protein, partial [Actinomycetota bacterium]|nr:UvrD-helicase domain-containing protein [Actinomycetota bacterium]